jgi:hypothetical protein
MAKGKRSKVKGFLKQQDIFSSLHHDPGLLVYPLTFGLFPSPFSNQRLVNPLNSINLYPLAFLL